MAIATELRQQVTTVTDLLGDDVCTDDLPSAVSALDDEQVLELLRRADALRRSAERVRIVASGVVAARSKRAAGHDGLAQKRGHRTSASLIQQVTGSSRSEAASDVRVGESLLEDAMCEREHGPDADSAGFSTAAVVRAWHAPLSDALMAGAITKDQHAAILRGLGEPPLDAADLGPAEEADAVASTIREAWRLAAQRLAGEAQARTVEELRQQARTIRDQLDPQGAARRFQERYEQRAFRTWTDADGGRHARIDFDDEAYAWVRTIIDTALRPRRGGPRFVDPDEKSTADALVNDARSNDQLAYDLVMDVLRAGALADAGEVFGARQPGVRLVRVETGQGEDAGGHTEDGLVQLPAAVIEQHICDTGTVHVTVDSCGNPLDVGREHRLFTPKQRIGLAIRDGGCRWPGCDRPASYCEAHHVDEWHADHGRTDIDRGILLCRFHHLQLHLGSWRITRDGKSDFVLHPPGGAPPITLTPRLALRYAWDELEPPPKRFRPQAA